jgi:hypothetical protein
MSSHASLDQRLKDAQEMAVTFLSSTACVLTKEQIDLLEEKLLKTRLSLLPSFGLPKSPKEEVLEGGSLPSLDLSKDEELNCHSYFSSGHIFPEVVSAIEIVEPVETVSEVEVLEEEVEQKPKVPYRKDYNDNRSPSPRPKLFVNRLLGLKKSRLTHGYCLEYLSKRLRITEEEFKQLTPQEV